MAIRKARQSDAKKAIEQAQSALEEVRAQAPEVEQITTELAEIREKNHFSERILAAMELRNADPGKAIA